jgi:DNA-binding response OmpR family regulator
VAKVLLHESDPALRRLLELQLRRLGHEPVVADAGSAAVTADIAVVEPADPAGLALARSLRAWRPELPLVFLSTREPTQTTRELTPEAHALKPWRLAELGRLLERVLGGT